MLAISNTGVGMPPDVVERAMEPFFTTKEMGKGTGLGLSMIYGFAKQSRGHLNIYSEVGVGTTVRLYLPRSTDECAAPKPTPEPEASPPAGGEAILLVDDNEPLRRVTLRRLVDLGYRVEEAQDGPSALALLDEGRHFDLLFSDIGLPGGMNGRALADQARQRCPELAVLLTTGYGNEGDHSDIYSLIRKPYRGNELAAKLREALSSG